MGVFGPTLEVPGLPAMLPGLCAILIVRNPQEPLTAFTVSVVDSAGKEVSPPSTQKIAPEQEAKIAHQFQVKIVPFPVSAEGDVTFRFTFNDTDEIGVELRITIRKKPSA
jgi:hypothetical protein